MGTSLIRFLCYIYLFSESFLFAIEAKPVQKYSQHEVVEASIRVLRNVRNAEHKKGEVDMGLLNSMLNLEPTMKPVDLPEEVAVTAPVNFRGNLGKRKSKKGNEVDMDLLNSMLNLKPTFEPIDLPEVVAVTAGENYRDNIKQEQKKGKDIDMDLLNSMLNLEPTVEPVDIPEAVMVTAAPENFREVNGQGSGNDAKKRKQQSDLNKRIDQLLGRVAELEKGQ